MHPNYRHLSIIEEILVKPLEERGSLYVGNNLNDFFNFGHVENYTNGLKKRGDDRTQKSSKDSIAGKLAEEILIFLLEKYFLHNQLDYGVISDKNLTNTFKIINRRLGNEKTFDVDIVIKNNKKENKYFLISCKGSSRERIGQFLSNLFLMDNRLIKQKYNDKYYLDFHKKNIKIRYGFVCYDWAKTKDFVKNGPKGKPRKTIKQTEVLLINDDDYIGGGVTVLNNLENLTGVINFGELTGKISKFLN